MASTRPPIAPPVRRWAFGILLFELLAGKAPFSVGDDPMDTYANICEGHLSFPWFFHLLDRAARDVISALLTKDPEARLGSLAAGGLHSGGRQVRRHAFFRSIDFVALERREIPAPHVPTVASTTDASNFESPTSDSEDDSDDDSDADDERASFLWRGPPAPADGDSPQTLDEALAAWDTVQTEASWAGGAAALLEPSADVTA